jgi:hydrogenase expression/formation protein HypC
MCLALPVQITQVNTAEGTATVSLAGIAKEISLALLDDVRIGDYVLLHAGFALSRISAEEAQRTLALLAETAL